MKKILNNFEKIFLIFLYIQPILDVTAGVLLHFGCSITISSIIRFIFMFLCIIYLLFLIRDKKVNTYLLITMAYFLMFTITILVNKGIPALSYEIKNLITTYYFVIILITLTKLYKNKKLNVKNLYIIYIIYLLFVFIPNILGIGFDSYWHSKEGSVGWFLSANVVGSILSILLPIILMYVNKINLKLIILTIINLFVILSIGTKVPVLSFILIIGINAIYYFINLLKKKQYKKILMITLPFIMVIASLVIIFPKTSFYKNLEIHINYLEKKDNGKISTWHLIDHFIFSQRLTFEEKTRKAYNKASISEKIFGIGYIENYMTDNVRLKTIEIDYFDIFYRHGIVGFIIFFAPLIYILKDIIQKNKKINYKTLNIYISVLLIFILALFQGHILVTPANSIYVALILSIIYNNAFIYKNKLKIN